MRRRTTTTTTTTTKKKNNNNNNNKDRLREKIERVEPAAAESNGDSSNPVLLSL